VSSVNVHVSNFPKHEEKSGGEIIRVRVRREPMGVTEKGGCDKMRGGGSTRNLRSARMTDLEGEELIKTWGGEVINILH